MSPAEACFAPRCPHLDRLLAAGLLAGEGIRVWRAAVPAILRIDPPPPRSAVAALHYIYIVNKEPRDEIGISR